MKKEKGNTYQARINILQDFLELILEYSKQDLDEVGRLRIRSKINQKIMAVRSIVDDAGTNIRMVLSPPGFVRGPTAQNINPFDMIFDDWYGESFIPKIVDVIEQAIGVYENLKKDTGLIDLTSKEAIDIENAIVRALRPSFKKAPPSSEIEVQDAVENIFNSIGIDFTREKENTTIGSRSFRPDFVVNNLNLAIEIKLATDKHEINNIQEEITSDITAYKTKWKHILFVIYDNGVIIDPYKFRVDNIKLFGISVIVVKH